MIAASKMYVPRDNLYMNILLFIILSGQTLCQYTSQCVMTCYNIRDPSLLINPAERGLLCIEERIKIKVK